LYLSEISYAVGFWEFEVAPAASEFATLPLSSIDSVRRRLRMSRERKFDTPNVIEDEIALRHDLFQIPEAEPKPEISA
jgi:hypothetical protein